ncbi:MAG TPA: MarR family transcriptional regulator [Solirubrobacteraceae bacterium]|nr:MarR family transcriptional regulator [Solirubrobacteraceae bacterium]
MPRPFQEPIGLRVDRTAKALSRAFDDALAQAGGSRTTWLVLAALKRRAWGTQRELARELGIEGPTLTHHLDGLERTGLVTRTREPSNRRVQRVELTAAGDEAFHRLRRAAMSFDRRLRQGLPDEDVARLRELLDRLAANVAPELERLP